ncbi:MAG: 3-dehydroquinate dehydratase [Propionibacteriaceae bacterium]|jgi:3-dehydroquinate dehydratase-2|nr:3-dehydroquinate dehydratase [Propionibacteriaceae bacterium]
MTKVLVLNGVNLGRLGVREPAVYGSVTHEALAAHLTDAGAELGLEVEVRQTDSEATIVGWLHEAADAGWPVIINPGAWSHYSYAIADAAREVKTLVEVHISNIHAREGFRDHSVISPVAVGVIAGLGMAGYDYALAHVSTLA